MHFPLVALPADSKIAVGEAQDPEEKLHTKKTKKRVGLATTSAILLSVHGGGAGGGRGGRGQLHAEVGA